MTLNEEESIMVRACLAQLYNWCIAPPIPAIQERMGLMPKRDLLPLADKVFSILKEKMADMENKEDVKKSS